MNTALNVLLVEDQVDDAMLVERELRRGGFQPRCVRIDTASALELALKDESWDVIICDYSLPHFSGMEAFNTFKRTELDIPFIIVSGTIGEETAVAAMRAGVQDYIMKGNLARLTPAIQRELRDAADRRARKEAESQLKQTERLRMIGEMMASLIHDLNNPLQTILGMAEMLKSGQLPVEKRTKHAGMIEREVGSIIEMRNDFLEFTRGNSQLTLSSVNVAEIVAEVVDTYSPVYHDAGVTLTWSMNMDVERAPVIKGNAAKLWRVLQNLIANAKDAMPEGGRLSVAVNTANHGLIIEVSDSGAGIPQEIRQKLFTPFVTHGKSHGTGLGLAIVKRITEAHGGTVNFVTEERVGTTFKMTFPWPSEHTPALQPLGRVDMSAAAGKR